MEQATQTKEEMEKINKNSGNEESISSLSKSEIIARLLKDNYNDGKSIEKSKDSCGERCSD